MRTNCQIPLKALHFDNIETSIRFPTTVVEGDT